MIINYPELVSIIIYFAQQILFPDSSCIILFRQRMQLRMNKDLLDEEDLDDFYKFTNRIQKKYTQSIKDSSKIDLFVVLDISGSMNQTCKKTVNTGAGYLVTALIAAAATALTGGLGGLAVGGLLNTGGVALMRNAKSRLRQAKAHLIIQIRGLIRDKRINKLGLITFNHKAKVARPLTDKFDKIINQIDQQSAQGQTALYDSLKFAANQLRCSENPRILIMTDGQDNCSTQRDMKWAQEWFGKDGLKSTFFTICEGNNSSNQQLAKTLRSNYINIGDSAGFLTALMIPSWQEAQIIQDDLHIEQYKLNFNLCHCFRCSSFAKPEVYQINWILLRQISNLIDLNYIK